MEDLSLLSRLTLYPLLGLLAFFSGLLAWFQAQVLRGKAMPNPDGSFDDWHRQKTHYGIAVADLFITVPATVAAIVAIFLSLRWGLFFLSMVGYFYVWANTMTTVTSLRFERPKITLMWIIVFPAGIVVGLAVLAWVTLHLHMV